MDDSTMLEGKAILYTNLPTHQPVYNSLPYVLQRCDLTKVEIPKRLVDGLGLPLV